MMNSRQLLYWLVWRGHQFFRLVFLCCRPFISMVDENSLSPLVFQVQLYCCRCFGWWYTSRIHNSSIYHDKFYLSYTVQVMVFILSFASHPYQDINPPTTHPLPGLTSLPPDFFLFLFLFLLCLTPFVNLPHTIFTIIP